MLSEHHRRPAPEPGDPAIAAAELLAAVGSLLSALRKPLREKRVDLRLARLLLTFPVNGSPLRITQIAWRLGITTGAATRLVDRADRRFLVDQHDGCTDPRSTWVNVTREGWALRDQVDELLRAGQTCKTARIPSPMMNRPPSPYASSSQPRAFQT
jgi:DNA-binding MarR family transcriptional regulator